MKKIIAVILISTLLASTGLVSAAAETNPVEAAVGEAQIATPYTINGGTTGVFSRQQLLFEGFDGVQADVTLPVVTIGEKGDCPYVYFGFDWKNDVGNAEGGFQFVEDTNNPNYNKWTVFMRQGNDWKWGDTIVLEQGSTHHIKFYSVTVSEKQVDLVIELDGVEKYSGDQPEDARHKELMGCTQSHIIAIDVEHITGKEAIEYVRARAH